MSDTPENKPEQQEQQNDTTEVANNKSESTTQGTGESGFDINTVIEDAKKVILSPVEFYKNMPQSGGYADPLVFAAAMGIATGLVLFVFGMIGLAKFNPVMGGFIGLSAIFVIPIFIVIFSFIGAAILFVIWKLMGSEKNYEVAFRCVAYSMAILPVVAVISFIPYVANIIKTLWSFFLFYLASIHVHQLKEQNAKLVFGILAALSVIFGINTERDSRSAMSALKKLERINEMTPEEAGKEFGKFMKGLEEFSKGVEESTKEAKKD